MLQWLIYTMGYYLGIAGILFEGWRWKTGRCSLQQLLIVFVAIVLVFFAPNIVSAIRSASGGIV